MKIFVLFALALAMALGQFMRAPTHESPRAKLITGAQWQGARTPDAPLALATVSTEPDRATSSEVVQGTKTVPTGASKAATTAHTQPTPVERARLIERATYWMGFGQRDEDSLREKVMTPFPKDELAEGNSARRRDQDALSKAAELQLGALADELVVRFRDAYADYYGGGRFPMRHANQGALEDRPKAGSAYATYIVTQLGDWSCDLGFRSAEYPMVDLLLHEASRLRQERDTEMRSAGSN